MLMQYTFTNMCISHVWLSPTKLLLSLGLVCLDGFRIFPGLPPIRLSWMFQRISQQLVIRLTSKWTAIFVMGFPRPDNILVTLTPIARLFPGSGYCGTISSHFMTTGKWDWDLKKSYYIALISPRLHDSCLVFNYLFPPHQTKPCQMSPTRGCHRDRGVLKSGDW